MLKMDGVFDITKYPINNDFSSNIISACNDADNYFKKSGKQGQVYIPTGNYKISQLTVKNISNVIIHLATGATISVLPKGSWKLGSSDECITINNCENFTLYGETYSIIDGFGVSWWKKGGNRPDLISFDGCNNFEIYGLTIQNSPNHTCVFSNCSNFKMHDCNVLAPADSPNTDGIDIMGGVSNAEIYNCNINNGDDGFAINSGRDTPVTNISIHDCTVTNGHGVSLGSELRNTMKDVTFKDLKINDSEYGLRIKFGDPNSTPAHLENITYENIQITGVTRYAFYITTFYSSTPDTKSTLSNVSFNNINATKSQKGISITMSNTHQVLNPIVFNNVMIVDTIDTSYKNKINVPITIKGNTVGVKQ